MIIRKYFNLENFVSFALMFEKLSLNKQKNGEKRYKKFWFFKLCKFLTDI